MKLHEIDFEKLDGTYLIDDCEEVWKVDNGELVCFGSEDEIGDCYSLEHITRLEFTPYPQNEWIEKGDCGYVIDSEGCVNFEYSTLDEAENLNAFSTYEKAKEVADIQLLLRKIMKFRDENDKNKVDFLSKLEQYWTPEIIVNTNNRINIVSEAYNFSRNMLGIGFSSRKLCERCIDEIIVPYYKDKGYNICR